MALPTPDRHGAERQLIVALLELMIHELGNPLQSLTMLVELSLVGLRESEGSNERAVARLERAFESTDRLQRLVHAGGRVGRMFDHESERTWAEQLDPLLDLFGGWLLRRRVTLARETEPIDGMRMPCAQVQALAWLLLGAGESVRTARLPAATLLLSGRGEGEVCELAVVLEQSDGARMKLPSEPVRNAAQLLAPHGELQEWPDGELTLRCRLPARQADAS
ncbi:hypothetical protein ACNOYE_12510 [Nannocystaceae bacterium ST9]